jgi:hypothetical protein
VVRSFLPWKTIAKQFSEAPVEPEPPSVPTRNKVVFEDESDDDDDDEEVKPNPISISEEEATIDIDTFSDAEEEVDPLKDIESKAKSNESTLVLNL